MSSTPSPTFENYPGSTSQPAEPGEWRDPAPRSTSRLVPGRAPSGPPPGGPSDPSRRRVLAVIGGSVAGLAVLGILSSQHRESGPTWPVDSASTSAEEPDDSENATDVQGHTVSWPDGWTIGDLGDNQLVLVGGGATMIFRVFTAGDDATAVEEAQRLLTRHTASLRKRSVVRTTKGGRGSVETGTAAASGTRDGRTIDAEARVAIDRDEDGEALAVIVLQPSGTSSKRQDQISRMRRRFLDQISG